jgi:hypothetical protein
MEHPQPYSDTDPRAMEVWLDLHRKKPLGEKIANVLAFSDFIFHLSETGVRMQYPQASEREVFLRAAARHLSRDLMIRAYGWDPEEHEDSGGCV